MVNITDKLQKKIDNMTDKDYMRYIAESLMIIAEKIGRKLP